MRSHMHLLITFIIGGLFLLLLDIFSWKSMLVMLIATIAIDLDHLFFYLGSFVKQPRSLRYVWVDGMGHYRDKKQQLFIFHTLEFVLVLFYFSRQDFTAFLVFFSALVHLLTDQLTYYFYHKDLGMMVQWTGYWHVRKKLQAKNS
ncbi:MAG: hypothetical protein V1743_04140 [Nanoarchaeota archaeon]